MKQSDHERMVKELEVALDRLNALYNQYFMGIEKLEPMIPRKDVERKINALRKEKIRNTALRFRFQSQIQKYSTHSSHWRRICRQIEEGTYQRDVMRAKKRTQLKDEAELAAKALSSLGDGEDELMADASPVYDLGEAFNAIDSPFGDDVSLSDHLKAIDDAVSSLPMDDVMAANPADARAIPDRNRGGVNIPSSSLRVSQKTAEAEQKKTLEEAKGAGGNRMPTASTEGVRRPAAAPPIPPSSTRRPAAAPPIPPSSARRPAAPPPLPPPGKSANGTGPVKAAAPPPQATAPKSPRPPAQPPSSANSKGGVSDARIQAVYRAYVTARKRTNESTENISLQKISALLRKQQKQKSDIKDFKVVIRNGKAVIKSVKE